MRQGKDQSGAAAGGGLRSPRGRNAQPLAAKDNPRETQSRHFLQACNYPRAHYQAPGTYARRSGRFQIIASWAAVYLGILAGGAADEPVGLIEDRVGDAVVRRMDMGADGPVDPDHHRQPDIIAVRISCWQPDVPHEDLFTGAVTTSGDFFRLDIIFDGLVNPPGPTGCCGFPFAPFQYGNHPVFGYIEIDMDASRNKNTGGELDLPEWMYLGNAARFGGLPVDPILASRCARDASAFDSNIMTPPLVDRSGEDFHIALHGWEITSVQGRVSADLVFGPGDVWLVSGRLFPRARGYERFSFADTGGHPGRYNPIVHLRFAHSTSEDRTTVSLVYPLNNRGSAAQMNAGVVEPLDGDAANQNSVLEALDDLVFSAANAPPIWRDDPAFALIAPWALLEPVPGSNSAARFLDPLRWRITVLVGGSYTVPSNDVQFVWSDVLPDVRPGDFNGDGRIDWRDRWLLERFILEHDGAAERDKDGRINCVVSLTDFGPNFSVFDVNYDGRVDVADLLAPTQLGRVPGDLDGDADVDQTDFGMLQACLGTPVSAPCLDADLDLDHDVDNDDGAAQEACASGPGIPADPGCWPPPILSCPATGLTAVGQSE